MNSFRSGPIIESDVRSTDKPCHACFHLADRCGHFIRRLLQSDQCDRCGKIPSRGVVPSHETGMVGVYTHEGLDEGDPKIANR